MSHARDADWDAGLRAFFAYRDLGVASATQGRVGAHVIRARGASDAPGQRHRHALDFQMVYVLRGWVDFEYDGAGRVRLEAGSCVVQPPGSGTPSSRTATISRCSRSPCRRSFPRRPTDSPPA